MKKLLNHGILISALLTGAALPLCAQQTQPGEMNETRRQEWKEFHQQMSAKIKQQDAELEKLVTQMNHAPKNQKTDAIAAVVNKMVEDRLANHKQWETMHEKMHETHAPAD